MGGLFAFWPSLSNLFLDTLVLHLINKGNFCQTEEIEACLDKTWVVSAQSEAQKILLAEQPTDDPLVVKGPFNVYLREQVVSYFLLIGKTRPEIKDDTDPDGNYLYMY